MAIRERWQLTDSRIASLEHNPDMPWCRKDDGVQYYDACFMLVQMAAADDITMADCASMDDRYTVIINTETGVIYESALVAMAEMIVGKVSLSGHFAAE